MLSRRVGSGGSESISISLLSPAARSAPRSLKAVNFSFTQPFIQCILNANCARLCKGGQDAGPFCFQALSV